MKEKKEWTREEVERFITEEDLQRRAIALMPRDGGETFSNWDLFEVILQTRLDLETAKEIDNDRLRKIADLGDEITRLRGALERIAETVGDSRYAPYSHDDGVKMKEIAREALKENP